MAVAILVLARTLHMGSAMLLVTFPFFIAAVLRPNSRTVDIEDCSGFIRSSLRWLWFALGAEAFSGAVWFWFATAQMSDQSPWTALNKADLQAALWQTQFGRLWIGRAAIGAVMGATLFFISRCEKRFAASSSGSNWLLLVPGSLLLATLAWAGHAGSGQSNHALHLAADVLHLVIGAVWPIGLVPLCLFLWHSRAQAALVGDNQAVHVLRRFSQASFIAVLLIVGTGVINGWLMMRSWNALVTTTYGILLLVKVLVVLVMIGLGAINRLCLLPRLSEGHVAFTSLRQTVAVESCLAAVVLFIVGMMGLTAPPSQ